MTTRPPAVSVVLPVYNRAGTLHKAVSSVLAQGVADVEVIVVDDGSTDDTVSVLEAMESSLVRVVRMPENRGQAAARNAGAAAAHSDILAFQDSDDIWLPGRLSAQLDQLRNAGSNVALSYGRALKSLPNGGTMRLPGRSHRRLDGDLFTELSRGNFIGLPAVLIRRLAFEAVGGFDERIRCLEDWELFLRLARRYDFAFLDRVVVESPTSADGVNSSAVEALRALAVIREVHVASFAAPMHANLLYLEGDALLRRGHGALARRRWLEALAVHAWHAKTWFALLASLAGRGAYAQMKSTAARLRHGG